MSTVMLCTLQIKSKVSTFICSPVYMDMGVGTHMHMWLVMHAWQWRGRLHLVESAYHGNYSMERWRLGFHGDRPAQRAQLGNATNKCSLEKREESNYRKQSGLYSGSQAMRDGGIVTRKHIMRTAG